MKKFKMLLTISLVVIPLQIFQANYPSEYVYVSEKLRKYFGKTINELKDVDHEFKEAFEKSRLILMIKSFFILPSQDTRKLLDKDIATLDKIIKILDECLLEVENLRKNSQCKNIYGDSNNPALQVTSFVLFPWLLFSDISEKAELRKEKQDIAITKKTKNCIIKKKNELIHLVNS